jgi:hypothetical protein
LEKSPSVRKGFVAGTGGAAASVETAGNVCGESLGSATRRVADTTDVEIGEDSFSEDASRSSSAAFPADRVEIPLVWVDWVDAATFF